ncbi:MAG TPA: HAMP domain-containing sensor histidine kinase [Polyangia bacterium]
MRGSRLQWKFGVLSLVTTMLLLVLAGVAVRSVAISHRSATDAARADLAALEDATNLEDLLYQKGFVSEYFLTGDHEWLAELGRSRADFDRWVAAVTRNAGPGAHTAAATGELVAEYGRYDADRARAIAEFDTGQKDRAVEMLVSASKRVPRLRQLALDLIRSRRGEVMQQLAEADRVWEHALAALAIAVTLAIFGALGGGYLLARRVARPLYDLVLRAESAAGGTRVEVTASDEIGALSEHVTRLARRIEESSAALSDQRARLVQAEKMSALGEMATAVAHELLNPLTGVKTALQLLDRTHKCSAPEVHDTVTAVDAEVHRVEQMARRLMSFARPAMPQPQSIDLDELMPRLVQATAGDGAAHRVRVVPALNGVRVVTADPDLLLQVLVNLVVNACQATPDGGEPVEIRARAESGWRIVEVVDRGRGLSREVAARLFSPFVTDKRDGHGLGLAVSQNIALAHGGRLEAHPNSDGRGMTFSLWLPEAAS